MNIVFLNNGVLSLIDITTMGDSCKRDDDSKIGRFDSGLKYAIAIMHRNGIDVEITSGGKEYKFASKVISDEGTGKKKEVLTVNDEPTAFSPQLGIDWKVWMAYRELYSNCLDEGGEVVFTDDLENLPEYDTKVVVKDCEYNIEMERNWDKYFISKQIPLYSDDSVCIYPSKGKTLLYKNGILVYKSDKHSLFNYDYKNASIDERRVLNGKDTFMNQISHSLMYCTDYGFIEHFFSNAKGDYFEKDLDYYWSFSDEWVCLAFFGIERLMLDFLHKVSKEASPFKRESFLRASSITLMYIYSRIVLFSLIRLTMEVLIFPKNLLRW
jgi:hypothetical protein